MKFCADGGTSSLLRCVARGASMKVKNPKAETESRCELQCRFQRGSKMKLSAIKVDSKLAEQGDWVDGIPDLPGIRIKARGINNADYRLLEAKLVREIPRGDRLEGLKPADQDRITGTLLLETVVVDVEGLEEDSG